MPNGPPYKVPVSSDDTGRWHALAAEYIDALRQAWYRTPIDWRAVDLAVSGLAMKATTENQKAAVRQIKRALETPSIRLALQGVERAFLGPNPNVL